MKKEWVLGLETSCDETALAVLEVIRFEDEIQSFRLIHSSLKSQVDQHAFYGGVIPELAARDHLTALVALWEEAQEVLDQKELSSLVVTQQPGLIGALRTGHQFAKGLACALKIPLKGIDHIQAHLMPAFFPLVLGEHFAYESPEFPVLGLTISGGHTRLVLVNSFTDQKILGESCDDACGECLDKVGKLLGLDYPAGALVEKKVDQWGKEPSYDLLRKPIETPGSPYNFSFSGVKTAALRKLCERKGVVYGSQKVMFFGDLPEIEQNELCAALEKSCFDHLLSRVHRALEDYPQVKGLFVAGGVAANQHLRRRFEDLSCPVKMAPLSFCTDNAVMVCLQSLFHWNWMLS